MEGFKVESGIPLPTRPTKYPWAQLKVGDSFLVPVPVGEDASAIEHRLHASGRSWAKANKVAAKFSVRVVDGGVRAWLVASGGQELP